MAKAINYATEYQRALEQKRAGSVEGASEVQRIYSFEHDDDYIYSAFLAG